MAKPDTDEVEGAERADRVPEVPGVDADPGVAGEPSAGALEHRRRAVDGEDRLDRRPLLQHQRSQATIARTEVEHGARSRREGVGDHPLAGQARFEPADAADVPVDLLGVGPARLRRRLQRWCGRLEGLGHHPIIAAVAQLSSSSSSSSSAIASASTAIGEPERLGDAGGGGDHLRGADDRGDGRQDVLNVLDRDAASTATPVLARYDAAGSVGGDEGGEPDEHQLAGLELAVRERGGGHQDQGVGYRGLVIIRHGGAPVVGWEAAAYADPVLASHGRAVPAPQRAAIASPAAAASSPPPVLRATLRSAARWRPSSTRRTVSNVNVENVV